MKKHRQDSHCHITKHYDSPRHVEDGLYILNGKIIRLEPTRELLFVRPQKRGGKIVLRWEPETRFVVEGDSTTPAVLSVGQRVAAHYHIQEGQEIAEEIGIEFGASLSGGKPRQHEVMSVRAGNLGTVEATKKS